MSVDPAPARTRVAAALIDMLPVLVLLVGAVVIATVTAWQWWVPLVPLGLAAGWTVVLWQAAAADGRPPGKRLLGLAEVTDAAGAEPGSVPEAGRALGRLLLRGVLSLVTVGVAGLSYRWDPSGRQRTWWDRMLGTAVVEAAPGGRAGDHAAERWAPGAGDEDADVPAPMSGPFPVASPAAVDRSGAADLTRRPPSPAVPARAVLPAVPSPAVPAPAVPAPGMPPVSGGWRPSRDSAAAAAFLATPLIGGSARAVPHTELNTSPATEPDHEIITGIVDSGRPLTTRAPSPSAPSPLDSGPQIASQRPPSPLAPSPLAPSPLAPSPSALSPLASAPKHRAPEQYPAVSPTLSAPPAPPPWPAPNGAGAGATARVGDVRTSLVWDTGRHVTVSGRVLIGRDPAAADGEIVDHLLPVTTGSVGVSKTHLLLEIGMGGITVTDRQSTNGVRVVRADGSIERCEPGAPLPLDTGDAVHFGGRFITIAGAATG